MKVMREVNTVARLTDVAVGGPAVPGYLKVSPAANDIRITNFDVNNLPISSNVSVMGQITFEIDQVTDGSRAEPALVTVAGRTGRQPTDRYGPCCFQGHCAHAGGFHAKTRTIAT